MKLDNHLITSLDCFRRHFSFIEAWSKRRILVRDLSPDRIHYAEEEDERIYNALKNPSDARIKDGFIFFSDGNKKELSLSPEVTECLKSLGTDEDRVCAVALGLLAKADLSPDDIRKIAKPDVSDEEHNVMRNGDELRRCDMKVGGSRLKVKKIYVPVTEKYNCRAGDVDLEPGDVTFGVFQDNNLIAVSPCKISNNAYYLRYVPDGDDVRLAVYDLEKETMLNSYTGVKFISLIGDDDFAMVKDRRVYCRENNVLNDRLYKQVEPRRNPMIIKTEHNRIRVVYEDMTEITVDIKKTD